MWTFGPWFFWRSSLSALGLLIMIALIDRRSPLKAMLSIGAHGAWVAFSFAIGAFAFVFAIMNTAVANALVIMSSSPLPARRGAGVCLVSPTSNRGHMAHLAAIIALGLGVVLGGRDRRNFRRSIRSGSQQRWPFLLS